MKLIKNLVLMMYETYLHLDANGYKDYLILINTYEYAQIGLILENKETNINIDINKAKNSIIAFNKLTIGKDKEKVLKLEYEFNNAFSNKYNSLIKLIEITINKFLHQDYNFSEEDMIKNTKLDIEWDKGVFGIDVDVI